MRFERSYWAGAAIALYIAFSALRASGGRGPALAAVALVPLALAGAWRLTSAERARAWPIDPEQAARARAALRVSCVGLAMLVSARSTTVVSAGFVATANAGAAIACVAALVAMSRTPALPGLLEPPRLSTSLDAAALSLALWSVAIALPAAKWAHPARLVLLDAVVLDYTTSTAALGSLGIAAVAAARLRAARRLELDMAERAHAALLVVALAVSIGIAGSWLEVVPPETLLPVCAAAACALAAACVIAGDGERVAGVLRTAVGLAVLAGPVAIVATSLAHQMPDRAAGILFIAASVASIAGLYAPRAARALAPRLKRWHYAYERATAAAMTPDPDAALEAALGVLQRAGGDLRGAGLYQLAPPEFIEVDRAGYVRREQVQIPDALVALAEAEPLRILRAPVLHALEVRRPEVRPVLAWMERRGAHALAVVYDVMGPIGLVAIPSPASARAMTLAEARALRKLADRLGAAIGVGLSLARSRQRELDAHREAEALKSALAGAEAAGRERDDRLGVFVSEAAARASLCAFSPAMKSALVDLERAAHAGGPITLLAPPGADARAWAALAHLTANRDPEKFVVVDGAKREATDALRLGEPGSAFERSRGGSLVVLDPQALDKRAQIELARAPTAGLIVVVPATIDRLVADGRMLDELGDTLGARAVALPALTSRSEDLRALALAFLGDFGFRRRGEPYGLSIEALARLHEHDFTAGELELSALLTRAALATPGDVVTVDSLAKAGLGPAAPSPDEGAKPAIPLKRKRGRPRAG